MEKKQKRQKRFVKLFSEGTMEGSEVWVDRETHVQYLHHYSGYAGGLTVLLDADGRPLLASEYDIEEAEKK